jgi:hypothetical protein
MFWDIMPCRPLKVNRRLEGTHHHQLQGQSISQARNQHKSLLCLPPAFMLVSCLAYSLTLKMVEIHSSETSADI